MTTRPLCLVSDEKGKQGLFKKGRLEPDSEQLLYFTIKNLKFIEGHFIQKYYSKQLIYKTILNFFKNPHNKEIHRKKIVYLTEKNILKKFENILNFRKKSENKVSIRYENFPKK